MQVKRGKTEKAQSGCVDVRRRHNPAGKPFFFVPLRIDGQELSGPRHVTEEAAKRDKESLDGKPIDEQLAGVASLGLLYYVTKAEVQSHRRHVKDQRWRREKKRHKAAMKPLSKNCWSQCCRTCPRETLP